MRRLSVIVPVLVWAVSWTSAGYGQERQIFVLNPGWNLIAFQVLPASCPAGDARDVFSRMVATDGSGGRLLDAVGEPVRLFDRENPVGSPLRAALVLEGVRTAEQDGGVSVTWRSLEPALPAEILRRIPLPEGFLGDRSVDGVHRIGDVLRCVAFAEAYLILVEGILPGAEYEVVGETAATVSRVNVGPGWNLIGLPFDVTVSEDDEPHIASLFPEGSLTTIRRIAGWDSSIQEYRSYFPDDPELSDLRSSDPNVGYWIEAADAFAFAPDLTITGPAAEDARVYIAAHETASRIPFYNAGGGAVGWSAALKPFSGPVPEGSLPLASGEAVNDVLSLAVGPVAQGSVAPIGPVARGLAVGETRYVEVLANRTRLPPATYVAHLDLTSGRVNRRFTVAVEVGDLTGQWAGRVDIDTVNGRRNAVPAIDVYLHLSSDDSGLLRGYIDSEQTVLWTSDAPFLGSMLDSRRSDGWRPDYRRRFVLEGGMTLPPGDANRYPYESYPDDPGGNGVSERTDPTTGLRYLTNAEGDRYYHTLPERIENGPTFVNPTPAFIGRQFQFLGQQEPTDRASGDDGELGGVPELRGRYVETVDGLLNGSIRVEGTFELTRVSPAAYGTRPLEIRHDETQARRSGGRLDTKIQVRENLLIHRAEVVVDQTAGGRGPRLVLRAPDGTPATLHAGDRPAELGRRVTFTSKAESLDSDERRPEDSLNTLRNRTSAGEWTLSWTHFNENARESFRGWTLRLFGPPIVSVAGRVEIERFPGDDAAVSFDDVRLDVVGLLASPNERHVDFDRRTGEFSIDRLPPLRIDILASKTGFRQAGIAGLEDVDHPRGFRDGLDGVVAGGPGSDDLTIVLMPTPPAVETDSAVGTEMSRDQSSYLGSSAASYAVRYDGRSRYRFVHGEPLVGFGARDEPDPGALDAQKTTIAKVDLDRVPRIVARRNESLRFDQDGLAGEDLDLYPRRLVAGSGPDGYAYVVIQENPDGRLDRLGSRPDGGYVYRDAGNTGRDVNGPSEPVVVHSSIGSRIVNLGMPATDGEYRLWVGAAPGTGP